MTRRMKPLPYLPDFPILQCAELPAGKSQYLEMWNLGPADDDAMVPSILDYVVLAVGDARQPEMLIYSRPSRMNDSEFESVPGYRYSQLVPVADTGLLSIDLSELNVVEPGGAYTKDTRRTVLDSLARGQHPWRRAVVQVDGQEMQSLYVSGEHNWLLVGARPALTVCVVGRGVSIADVTLVSTPRDELEQMVRT